MKLKIHLPSFCLFSVLFLAALCRQIPPAQAQNLAGSEAERPAVPNNVSWDLEKPVLENASRTRWSLAGWWRWQALDNGPTNEWAWIQVSDDNAPPKFSDNQGRNAGIMLLEREFLLPPEAKNKAVWLRFSNMENPDKTVYLNGRKIGDTPFWTRDEWNLTPFLKTGPNRLQIVLGPNWTYNNKSTFLNGVWLETRANTSIGTHLPFLITPSWRKKNLSVELPLSNATNKALDLAFSATIFDWKTGKEVAALRSADKVRLAPNAEKERHTLSFAWPDPVLWHPQTPNLLGFSLNIGLASGERLDSTLPERFGFREVYIEGRDLIMNGAPLHLRGNSHNYISSNYLSPADIENKKRIGMNIDRAYIQYKAADRIDLNLNNADELGYFVSMQVFPLSEPDNPTPPVRGEEEAEAAFANRQAAYEKTKANYAAVLAGFQNPTSMRIMLESVYNHPSYILRHVWDNADWAGFDNGPPGHPMQIGQPLGDIIKDVTGGDVAAKIPAVSPADLPGETQEAFTDTPAGKLRRALATISMYRGLDPTRPTYFYRRGVGGEVRGLMNGAYMGQSVPVQTMEEWPRFWSENGDQPLLINETSMLLSPVEWAAWQLGGGLKASIPLVVEHAARTIGDEAYAEADDELINATATNDINIASDNPLKHHIKAMVYEKVLRSWRTYGMNYMLHTESLTHSSKTNHKTASGMSEQGDIMARNNSPLLAYIGGPAEDFTRKDHAFFSGEEIQKQIIVRNDLDKTASTVASWRVLDGEKIIAKGEAKLDVKAGNLATAPIIFNAPEVKGKTQLVLALDVIVGEEKQSDAFAIEVFPRTATPNVANAKIGVFDPVGDTTAMLQKAGIAFVNVPADAPALPQMDLLIVGRNAYTHDNSKTSKQLARLGLDNAVANGLNVLVMEQSHFVVMGLMNTAPYSRNAFVRAADHPILAGLGNADLHDWRGASDIIADYPKWDSPDSNPMGGTRYPHWSNNGMVSTFWYQKPQAGNYRVLLDGGFDQMNTALLEMQTGRGRWVFSQLDLTNRYGVDPAASLIFNRTLDYLTKPAQLALTSVAYAGGTEGSKMLDELKIAYEGVASLDNLSPKKYRALVISSADAAKEDAAKVKAGLQKYLDSGGTVFVLPIAADTALEWLPVAVKVSEKSVGKTLVEPSGLFQGVAPADLFWREIVRLPVVTQAPKDARLSSSGVLADVPVGTGHLVLVQVSPSAFDVEGAAADKGKLMLWKKAKTMRLWQTLLSNAGAASLVGPAARLADPIDQGMTQFFHTRYLPFDPDQWYSW